MGSTILQEQPKIQDNQETMRLSTAATLVALTTTALLLAGCTNSHDQDAIPTASATSSVEADGYINLLAQNWNMPGVTRSASTLHVSPTGFKIVQQDGSGGQSNPPVNLYGTRLQLKQPTGNFSISITTANTNGDASLQLYAKPPIVSDEFRVEPPSLRLTETGSKLVANVMDGSKQDDVTEPIPAYTQTFALPGDADNSLTVSRQGDSIAITDNGKMVATIPWGKLFNTGNVLFGLDSSKGGFDVTALSVKPLDGNTATVIDTSKNIIDKKSNGLQELATKYRPGFKVGAAVALGPLTSDKDYAEQVVSNYGSITLENAMKPQFISPEQGVYDFQEADAIIAFAKQHNISVHGHTIAFSEAEPQWMRDLPTSNEAERQATAKILLDYATTVADHFKDKLDSLDVINEPLDADGGTTLQQNIWYKALGQDYAATVLRAVHTAAPNVKLFVNENGAEQAGDRQDAFFKYVKDLKVQGIPLYGVGLQSHVYDKDEDITYPEDLTAMINRLAKIGVKVRISEMDVVADGAYSDDDSDAGSGAKFQSWQYVNSFKACINNPNCVSFTTWGVNNKYDVYQDDNGQLGHGTDLLLNANGSKTKAYNDIRKLLASDR